VEGETMHELQRHIRDVPDFPKPGILFKDITPLLKNPSGFRRSIELLQEKVQALKPDVILGIESRGFIFGGALALQMDLGLLPARKPGKLPYLVDSVSYDLEYGSNTLQLHRDAVEPGQRVLIVDDLLATGGTAAACAELIRKQGGQVAGYAFVVELAFLNGRDKLQPEAVESLLVYE
jgi:adenine phosphoribosyltransferase